ncbi:MAG: ATP synthase F1 subunit gamma [Flavobacteriales bacterium]|jgi:F-type H+-transporting ATPase subunit gamma|nr:ATP synthase F1 subunit gamma [Flavobacteriales bacterium]MDA8994817.1 ATP synthase F1 subunit gamma [Schleiferiaceae bacterium]
MANLKELRNRITSIGSTMKITSAMKMVSAAKLKKAQDAIVQMRPYASKLTEILQKASSTLDSSENAYGEVRDGNKVRLVVISSNRGLCGGFNSSVVKKAKSYMAANPAEYTIATVGKKAHDAFKNDSRKVSSNTALWDEITFEGAKQEAQALMEGFVAGEFDKVVVVYNAFKNAAVQEPQAEQFLPIAMEEKLSSTEVTDTTEYIYEPSMQEILADLIPTSLKTQFFAALLDANASEHGARMTAMHKATDNAKALQGDLKLEYNKARQAAITNEILEIVGGADALAG